MKLTDNVNILEIKTENGSIFPVLIHDEENLAIVDSAFPLQINLIKEAVEKEGFRIENINKIILTHQDIDHIGNVKDILLVSKEAKVLAHEDEAPYLDGTKTPVKLYNMEKNLDKLPEESKQWYYTLKAGFENRRFNVDVPLKDGDIIPICGGVEVIHTPGHTPGHICLFVKNEGVLICGDGLNINDGKLVGANPVHTQDMELAKESIKKLQGYEIKSIVTYHGGLFQKDVKKALEDILN